MKILGLTGGIGSGKTTVAKVFEAHGYRVYYADERAKILTEENLELVQQIKDSFGDNLYDAHGKLNRPKLAAVVFESKEALNVLNGLVHPAVAKDFSVWMENLPLDYEKNFVLREAAILFEAGADKSCDAVLTVYAPRNMRMDRVVARDRTTRDAVSARMRNQMSDMDKCFQSDFVVFNDGHHELSGQIDLAIRFLEAKWR
jgi:dephospho-CoA kinase